MILNIRLNRKQRLPVKAHRVLERQFPRLKLYAHYGIKKGENSYSKGLFVISTENGFAITGRAYGNLSVAVRDTFRQIELIGEEKVAAKDREATEKEKVFSDEIISKLDTCTFTEIPQEDQEMEI